MENVCAVCDVMEMCVSAATSWDSPENVCAVCDVMEMCVSDCIRISENTAHTFSVRRSQDACYISHTAVCNVNVLTLTLNLALSLTLTLTLPFTLTITEHANIIIIIKRVLLKCR